MREYCGETFSKLDRAGEGLSSRLFEDCLFTGCRLEGALVENCQFSGCRFEGCSSIEVPVTVRLGCGAERGAQYVACAHVRLARGGESAPCDCVQTALDVCVQAWAVCCRAMAAPGQCAPECPPPLPLYPQPCRPPRDPWRPR